jgi:hypothetical protein
MAVVKSKFANHPEVGVWQLTYASFEVASVDAGTIDAKCVGAEKDGHRFQTDLGADCKKAQSQVVNRS